MPTGCVHCCVSYRTQWRSRNIIICFHLTRQSYDDKNISKEILITNKQCTYGVQEGWIRSGRSAQRTTIDSPSVVGIPGLQAPR